MKPSIDIKQTTGPAARDSRIDSVHRIPVKDNFFSLLELTNIKNTLYKTMQEEFIGLQIWNQTNEWQAGAREVGYDMYEPVFDASVSSRGADADDVKFVSEKLEEKSQKAVEIEVGIKYTRNEIEAADAKNAIGRGANLNLVNERATTARKAISMTVDKGIFQGFADYNMKGLQSIIPNARQGSLPTDSVTPSYESVPATGTSSSTLWSAKSGQLIYQDLLRAKINGVEYANIFKGDTLIVDTVAYGQLIRPYSDLQGQTLMKYIKDEGLFKNVFRTNAVAKANNGRLNTYFVVCDSDIDIAEIPVLRPITVFPSVEDWKGTIKQLCAFRYAGLMVKYPGAFYFGDGHIETPA